MQRLYARADDPTPSMKDLTQRVVALRGVFGYEGQGGSDDGPSSSLPSRGEGLRHTERIPCVSPTCVTGAKSCKRSVIFRSGSSPVDPAGIRPWAIS